MRAANIAVGSDVRLQRRSSIQLRSASPSWRLSGIGLRIMTSGCQAVTIGTRPEPWSARRSTRCWKIGARDSVQEKRLSEGRPVADQLCFSFDGGEPRAVSGVEIWRERRRAELGRFAAETGLPIGIWSATLSSGPFLEGNLFLFEEDLWLERQRPDNLRLRIGKVDFLAAEVESCVRLD